jgi:regulator of protease activity HflC (stomatin/prohibitin superfamily)
MEFLKDYWWLIILALAFLGCFVTVNQGTVGVVTMIGKYQRVMKPG